MDSGPEVAADTAALNRQIRANGASEGLISAWSVAELDSEAVWLVLGRDDPDGATPLFK